MDVKNYNRNRKKPVRKKGLRIVAFLLLFIGVVLAVFRYYKFMSKSIYEESVSHLTEVLHQSDQMLRELTNKNLTYLHIWGENLQNISGEDEIRDYIKKAQEDAGFLEFFFLSSDGDYKMATGETGYLGLQENIEEDIRQGNDVIANAAVPGKSQLLVFATPKAHGIYQGFEYDAIAIAYENSDIVDVLDISAFDGNAQSFIIHPDGRVVIDHSSELWGNVYNFFGFLSRHSDMSEKEINVLLEKFKAGRTDAMLLNLDGRNYYLVYEKSDIQDWMFLGLVQADIVNASMNNLQFTTMLLVGAVVLCIAAFFISLIIQKNRKNLRRKDVEIRYRDELFQKLSMNVDDVFLMLDAQTYQTDYVSPNAEKLLGITVEQIRKDIRVLRKLHPADSEDSQKNHLKEIPVHEQQEWDCEFIHRKTGERRWFHNIAMGSEVNGEKKYILVMSDRTSDRKMNQALSEAVHAAETANRAKSIFLSNMSHDIRTPMNAIIGFTSLAAEHLDDREIIRDYLEKISTSGKHLLSLINDVLDMSRIESGSVKIEKTNVHLPDVLEDLKTIILESVHAKQQKLLIKMQDVVHEDIITDKLRLTQVLLNIISNAVKFTPVGGTIHILVEEKASQKAGYAVYSFCIKDNGIGMSKEFQEHVFDSFARERTVTESGITGTGLGMAITKNIVDLMSGTIHLTSKQGEGSEFIVTLECELANKTVQDKQSSCPKAEKKHLDYSGKKVLLVEDNELNREIATEILKSLGMKVDCAADGMEAVEIMSSEAGNQYDMIFMDIQMPKMDGYTATREIRTLKDMKKANVPIIAMTANAFDEDRKKAIKAGMNGHIAKPIDVDVILQNLDRIFGNNGDEGTRAKE